MSNRRFIVLFSLGIVVLSAALAFLAWQSRLVATESTRGTLSTFSAAAVDAVDLWERGTNTASLVRDDATGEWRLTAPYPGVADDAVVARLVDMATVVPLGDMRTEAELAGLREDFSDFGLMNGGCLRMRLHAGGKEEFVVFGSKTASGREVYARTEGLKNVFTLPAEAFDAMPRNADGFRQRMLVSCPREEIAGIDLRAPGSPFVKLVRANSGWMLAAVAADSAAVAADSAAVAALVDGIVGARVVDFVSPSVSDPVGGALLPSKLVPYGLAVDAGHAVTVRTGSGTTEQIVFGSPAGTNRVYALIQNGTAVVTLDAAFAELCRAGGASFRDTRVFPMGDGDRVKSVSFTEGELLYVLTQDTNGVWRLEAPVVAPADSAAAAKMVERVLRLRREDVPDRPPEKDAVRVSVTTGAGTMPGVVIGKAALADCGILADLRSKVIMELDAASVRRISVRAQTGAAVAVARDPDRASWLLDAAAGAAPATVSDDGVRRLLAAVTRVEAVGVETVAATPDDYRRCGLVEPAYTVAIDFLSDAPRKNLLLGAVAPGGGRYAAAGGADAVFILSKAAVADLMTSITERKQ